MSVGTLLRKLLQPKNDFSAIAIDDALTLTEVEGFSILHCKNLYYQYLFEGSCETPLNIPQKLVIEVVINQLKKKESRVHAIPRLPSVIPKLLRSLRDPASSAKDYVAIIKKDPVMSAAVLKLANSVYFNPVGAHIDEIDRAVVKLGIQGIRSVLSAAVMQPIIQRESPYFSQTGQRLWVHSLNCAVACEVIAQARGLDRYKVYLMGLVHDIGKITLFSELCKQFKLNETADAPGHSAFAPTLKKISAHLSYIIACDWELPSDICSALKQQVGLSESTQL
ncbi:MAG TPA: HDOD domain-containing protein, partial [Marinagarivorans sp.]